MPLLAIILIYLLSSPFTRGMAEQYANLKVPFRLNNSFFGIGWAIMYFIIYVTWVYLLSRPCGNRAFWSYVFVFTLVLNYFWIVFFVGMDGGARSYGTASLLVIVNCLVITMLCLMLFYLKLYFPFWMMIIYLAWLLLATYQSVYVAIYN